MKARICWILCVLTLVPAAAAQQDSYPWLPGYRKPAEPVFPEIFMSPEEAAPLVMSGELRLLDAGDCLRPSHGTTLPRCMTELRDPRHAAAWCRRKGLRGDESLLLLSGAGSRGDVATWFWHLERAGFSEVYVLDGSAGLWNDLARMPNGVTSIVDSLHFRSIWRDSLSISPDSLLQRLGDGNTEILDLRDEEAYFAGHIPHALLFDVDEYLPAEGWPDAQEARELFSRIGPRDRDFVDLDAEFVLYGERQDTERIYLSRMLLKMMGVKARILEGGIGQWRTWGDRPLVRIVDDDEVAGLLDETGGRPILLDLRGHRDWRRSHIPGSVCLPAHVFADSLEIVLEAHWPGADRRRDPMILYCYGADCTRSRNGATLAARAGFLKLLWYREGIEGWRAAGLPLEP